MPTKPASGSLGKRDGKKVPVPKKEWKPYNKSFKHIDERNKAKAKKTNKP